jgi:hypothetical protein
MLKKPSCQWPVSWRDGHNEIKFFKNAKNYLIQAGIKKKKFTGLRGCAVE